MTTLILILIASSFVGFAIVANKLTLIFAIAGIFIYLQLPLHIKMLLLALGSLYPISFGAFGPINDFYWIEWMAPLFAIVFAFRLLSKNKELMVKGNLWIYTAFLALLITTVVNYTKNPVIAQTFMGGGEQSGGIRSYYNIFTGICLFFVFLWYFKYFLKDSQYIRKFLIITAVFSICLGFLQILAYLYHYELPLLYSVFRYRPYSPGHIRIGGLSECAVIGISSILGLSFGNRLKSKEIFALFLCVILLVLSGGRTHFGGALIALIVYMGLSGAKRTMVYTIAITSTILTFWFLSSFGFLGEQWERYATIGRGYDAIDQWRGVSYDLMMDSISRNPIFGKGIGFVGSAGDDAMGFALAQLKTGGHGGYLSILTIFGIFGLYFLITAIVYSVIKGVFIVKGIIPGDSSLSMFCLLLLIISAVYYATNGNGYSDPKLYFCVAILAGLSTKGYVLINEKK